ncbi:MAG TPA: ABC transporter ATP-binding protein [Chroococcidiopsis sp.]
MNEPIISFDCVSKTYPMYRQGRGIKNILFSRGASLATVDRYEALKDISFDIYKGESFGIIGRNGAGKSTTLGLIAGVLQPTAGRIVVRGRISPLLALGAGFNAELSGRENIFLNGILMGLTRREIKEKIDEIIEFTELGDFIERPIRVYSSGMTARLGFAVVAHLDPEILLIDEVLGVGDMKFQRKCADKMREFRESGVTMVLVTHSVPNIIKICDRAMWIDNHVVRMIGSTTEIAELYCHEAGVKLNANEPRPDETVPETMPNDALDAGVAIF